MSKRLIFMVVLVMSILTSTAQIANRSGIFVEAGIGGLVGNTLVDKGKSSIGTITTKAGVSYDVMAGYRWAFSRNWALDGRVGIDNPGTVVLDIMPGIRYTTNDIIANRSIFFEANVGISLTPFEEDYELDVESPVLQLQAGLNITSHLFAGVYYLGHFMYYDLWGFKGFDQTRNFGTMGVRLGYRF